MRVSCVALVASIVAGCGLKQMLPEPPAQTASDRTRDFPADAPSGVTYTGRPLTSYPVLPVQVFGAAYDLDLVIVSRHPEWNMHEYARLETPQGAVWIAKDARQSTMSQSIVADLPDIDAWMPEIPLPRKRGSVTVHDRSSADRLDLTLSYENIDGQPVVVTYAGPPPTTLQRKRNGSTMGHSAGELLAVLDLSHRDFGKEASVSIGGEDWPVKKILGVLPFRMAVVQAQGGLATGKARISAGGREAEPIEREGLGVHPLEALDSGVAAPESVASDGFFVTYEVPDGGHVRTRWDIEEAASTVDVLQVAEVRTLRYHYRKAGSAWELEWADVVQWGSDDPITHFEVSPALPDLRRPFEGRWTGRFVIDVNGQPNHAIGTIEAWWADDEAHVRVLPTEPWWAADRPMETVISYGLGAADVEFLRIPTAE